MAYQPDPPIPHQVMVAVKMFFIAFAIWLVGNVSLHAALWYRVVPDLRAEPRACGPSPLGDAAGNPNWPHVTKKLFGPNAGKVIQDPTYERLRERSAVPAADKN